jgi:hypothetical protein
MYGLGIGGGAYEYSPGVGTGTCWFMFGSLGPASGIPLPLASGAPPLCVVVQSSWKSSGAGLCQIAQFQAESVTSSSYTNLFVERFLAIHVLTFGSAAVVLDVVILVTFSRIITLHLLYFFGV